MGCVVGELESGAPQRIKKFCDSGQDKLPARLSEVGSHSAIRELDEFCERMFATPLNREELRVFFGTLRVFFHEVPGGILALALRLTDDWSRYSPFDATAHGAYILFANIDEFGLQDRNGTMAPTHHQLFLEVAAHLGLRQDELTDSAYALHEGVALAEATRDFYRARPIGQALGFHLASEATSVREFKGFFRAFRAHVEHYGLKDKNDPVLDFFRVHTAVEPQHRARGEEIIQKYLARSPGMLQDIEKGKQAFLDGFGRMFAALRKKICK